MAREFKESVRVIRADVRHVRGIGKAKQEANPEQAELHAVHQRWLGIGQQLQRIANMVYREWVAYHTTRGSHVAVLEYMEAKRLWAKTPTKDRKGMTKPGKCEVQAWPREFGDAILKTLQSRFPDVNTLPLGLAVHKLMSDLAKKSGVRTAFPRWMQMLADEIGPPSFARPLPIPLSNTRHILIPPDDDHTDWRFRFRVDRIEREGMRGTSTEDTIALYTRGRSRQALERIAAGEYQRSGANVCYSQDKNEWYIQIGYKLPIAEPAPLDPTKVARVRAGTNCPLVLVIDDREIPIGGHGEWLRHKRQSIQAEWNARNESYRWSRPPRKGKGRKRATELLEVLKGKWSRFTKDASYRLVARIMFLATEHGCGTIIIEKADAKEQETAMLWIAGQTGRTQAAKGWPMYFLEQAMNRKCNEAGIVVQSV